MSAISIESKGESAPGGVGPNSIMSAAQAAAAGLDVVPSESKHRQREPLAVGDRCTVYITGLPADTTLRELSNMLYFFPGYQKLQLYNPASEKINGVTPDPPELAAFVLFETHEYAVACQERLHHYVFDANVAAAGGPIGILATRLAMKNLVKRKSDLGYRGHISKGGRANAPSPQGSNGQGNSFGGHAPGGPILASPSGLHRGSSPPAGHMGPISPSLSGGSMSRGLKSSSLDSVSGGGRMAYPQPNHMNAGPNSSSISRYATATAVRPSSARASAINGGGKVAWPPCSTLFLSRLTGITDDDLAAMLQSCVGLRQHKFTQDKRGERVAFVDFDAVDQASHAMSGLQGHRGMQCSYARNPLNQRTRSSGGPMMGQSA